MKKILLSCVVICFAQSVFAWDVCDATHTKINYSVDKGDNDQRVLRVTKTRVNRNQERKSGTTNDYIINGKFTVLGPSSTHNYSNRDIDIDYILLGRHASLYIDTRSRRSDNKIVVYAAQFSSIYDYGSNVIVTDIDTYGDVTYQSNSFYLHHPFLYWGSVAGVCLVFVAFCNFVGNQCEKSTKP